MTDLSPAAAAVLDAYQEARDGQYIGGEWIQDEAGQVASALRAAATQFFYDWNGMCCEEHLKAIAAELEGTDD